jgi:hypothetical protein
VAVVELRGMHVCSVGSGAVSFYRLMVDQPVDTVPAAKRLAHYRLFGIEAEESPLHPERTARHTLGGCCPGFPSQWRPVGATWRS